MESKLCGRCHKPVSASLTTDDICRHCGAYYKIDDETNSAPLSGVPSKTVLITGLVIMGIVFLIVALGLTKFLNNQRLTESVTAASAVRESLALYAADDKNNLYPQKIEDWSALVYICNLHTTASKAPLAFTEETQGMVFLQYQAMDHGKNYILWLEVRGIPQNTRGKIIEISPSGLKKLTARELKL